MVARYHSKKYGPKPQRQFFQISKEVYLRRLKKDGDLGAVGIQLPVKKEIDVEKTLIERPFKYSTGIRKLKELYKLVEDNIIFYFKNKHVRYTNLDSAEMYYNERGRRTTYLLIDSNNIIAYDVFRNEYRNEKDIWLEDDDNYLQTYKATAKVEKRRAALRRCRNRKYEAKEKARLEEYRRVKALKKSAREQLKKGETDGHNSDITVQD